jgi:glycogen operon protein
MLPPKDFGAAWQPVIYTVDGAVMEGSRPVAAGAKLIVEARAVMVLQAKA